MVKVLIVLFSILFALSIYIAKPILAGGDQVIGDKGLGAVNQYWVRIELNK